VKILIVTCALVTAFCSIASGQSKVSSSDKHIVFVNVNVIPMDQERVIANQTVIIRDGKVSAMGSKLKYPKNAVVVNATGKYLIPGLAEMHAHVPPVDDIGPMKEVLMLFALNGVTTIRGMLGHPRHLELRSMIRKGEVTGPRFFTTGPSFNGMSITSPQAGAEAVRRQKQAGYDYLKLHPGLSREKFDSIAVTAKRVGIPFAGHVSFGVGVWRAIDAGYSSIDHLDGFVEALVPGIEKKTEQEAGLFGMFVADEADESRIDKLMQALKSNNIWVVPTQALAERWFSPAYSPEDFLKDPHAKYMKKETVDQWLSSKQNLQQNPSYDIAKMNDFVKLRRRLIKACQDHDVGLLLGCDAPQVFNVPGFSTHHELRYLVDSGLTPYQALRTGTVNVAKYLDMPDAGAIRPGAVADLVLLAANPLEDISATAAIDGVVLNGVWLPKEFIQLELKKLEKQ
jgi:imidazolonepropionase-like amidohydrolase